MKSGSEPRTACRGKGFESNRYYGIWFFVIMCAVLVVGTNNMFVFNEIILCYIDGEGGGIKI